MSAADLYTEGSVTVAGATAEYGIPKDKLVALMEEGRLPYSQLARTRYIPRVALRLLMARNLIVPVEMFERFLSAAVPA